MFYVLIILVLLIIVTLYTSERKNNDKVPLSLEKDGLVLMENPSKHDVLQELPEGYVFLDYEYTINGCTLSTFHRDVTSSQYIFKTKHPVYTFITYDYDGSALTVCPGSHKTVPILYSRPVTINAKSVLFNCDVVHAGSMNIDKKPRRAVQYKLAHKDDVDKLKHLTGIRKVKNGDCDKRNNVVIDALYRKLSILFSYVINHHMTPYLQDRHSNLLCKIIGEERCFYNM